MRRYNYIVTKKADGTWVGHYPGLPEIPPVEAESLRKVKKLARQGLITYLQTYVQTGQVAPKDTIKTYFHSIDLNRLERYANLEHNPIDHDLR